MMVPVNDEVCMTPALCINKAGNSQDAQCMGTLPINYARNVNSKGEKKKRTWSMFVFVGYTPGADYSPENMVHDVF